jgi:type IV pilus assembly protein PilZ
MSVLSSLRERVKFLNRRGAPRIPVSLPADFAQGDDSVFLFHHTTNISRTGAFIHAEAPLPVGSRIEVDFTLLGGAAFSAAVQKILCSAEVVNVTPRDPRSARLPGMGIRFVDLADADWDLLFAHVTAPRAEGQAGAARITVAMPEADPAAEAQQLRDLERISPELKQAVADFAWTAPQHAPRIEEDDAIPDEDLILEIEQRMQADGPDLRAVREGDPPPKSAEANFELRSDGIVEAKRAHNDLGLIAKDDGEAVTRPPFADDPISAIARIVEETDLPPEVPKLRIRKRGRRRLK